jgi:hypothetical protein
MLMEERLLVRSSENITKLLSLMSTHERNVHNYLQRNNFGIDFVIDRFNVDISNINQIFRSFDISGSLGSILDTNADVSLNITYTTFNELNNPNELTCPITQETFVPDDTVALLECGHYFKKDGFMVWARRSQTCPSCRTAFR